MTESPVLCDIRDAIAWVTLNRPAQLNALSVGLIRALAETLDTIEATPGCRAMVLTGAGKAFCAGGDLKEFLGMLEAGEPDRLEAFVREISALFARLEAMDVPVIAAVNGTTVAGGLELVLCCDVILAAEGAKIGDGHLRYGVLPGGGAAARLPRKIPVNKAAELFLSGAMKPAQWWAEVGLVSAVLPADQLLPEAERLASVMAGYSPLALRDIKHMVRKTPDLSLDDGLAHELDVFAIHARRDDLVEGLRAFSEKRQPVYRGR
ncbi:MAG: enoyl-CoA hydratase/isomerase family protein [Beijerinckiaceae bacterium]|jgi:enoyl-CoA hydratase/carnithine racemase|nr:enoyl-CoA hydratase/isomerase family protein [Beijerinckiaceae bacterium]